MHIDLKAFEAEALTLPVAQRAILAQHLLASLDEIEEQENERLWVEEAGRRMKHTRPALCQQGMHLKQSLICVAGCEK